MKTLTDLKSRGHQLSKSVWPTFQPHAARQSAPHDRRHLPSGAGARNTSRSSLELELTGPASGSISRRSGSHALAHAQLCLRTVAAAAGTSRDERAGTAGWAAAGAARRGRGAATAGRPGRRPGALIGQSPGDGSIEPGTLILWRADGAVRPYQRPPPRGRHRCMTAAPRDGRGGRRRKASPQRTVAPHIASRAVTD